VESVAQVPAEILGHSERGVIRPGAVADILVVDRELSIERIFLRGQEIELWENYASFQ
jgi:N-acetylglucosamine-6-phosphate deacetylase